MPLYEYECKDCSKQVEILVNAPTAKPDCPECGSKKLTKLLSVIGSPVIGNGSSSSAHSAREPGECGRSQCASGGCMFGN
jgi:putative FmdB family regulatory protein